ncbi:hypothetical protein E6C50_04655 [Flavobacterium supellecticarium]|uniref:WG containing repeat-containing protein n=1 Tax=Flavobacterium supellecticarium TaxID=2565924 RepID=A0A4S4A4T7_9FLAO|nr:hypothetical protein [Flavobacterium supellecticarium]THF53497.1 hypothetical protein E6C50_04655 [Flavobacterium supellecticarium]
MKKITLLVASIFLVGSMAQASENPVFSDAKTNGPRYGIDYRNAEPIMFMERGIAFYIFPNGEFDFNTQPETSGTVVYRNGRRGVINTTYGTPDPRNPRYYNTAANYGIRIEHDNFGRVRRVGNVFINYDSANRVKRVGTVYMSYNSFALSQVGGLRIFYNRRGQIVDISGYVNRDSQGYAYIPAGNNTNNGYYPEDDYNTGGSWQNNNDDYYYYRADGTKAKMTDSDIKEIKDK